MFIDVTSTSDVPEGAARAYEIAGRRIVIAHTSGGFFAADATCPHRGGPLAEGDVVGEAIVCPWHFWSFDLATGATAFPEVRLVTHDVRIEGDRITVQLRHPDEVATS